MLVVDQFLGKHPTQALHCSAHYLAMQGQRIDDATHIIDHAVIDQIDATRLLIDRHMRHRSAIGIRLLAIGKGHHDRLNRSARPGRIERCAQLTRSKQHGIASHHGGP